MKWEIREFRSRSFVESTDSFESGPDRCIRLYWKSDRRISYYVVAA